jgi:hypothetical protein
VVENGGAVALDVVIEPNAMAKLTRTVASVALRTSSVSQSCSHNSPDGGRSVFVGKHSGTKPGGRIRVDTGG